MNRFFRAIALVGVLGFALSAGGCADQLAKFKADVSAVKTVATNAVAVAGGVKIKSKAAYVAINVFNGIERSVTNYLRLPGCGEIISTVCRAHGFAEKIEGPFNAGIEARNNLRAWMKANPGTLADAGLYKTLISATNVVKPILTQYKIATAPVASQ